MGRLSYLLFPFGFVVADHVEFEGGFLLHILDLVAFGTGKGLGSGAFLGGGGGADSVSL